MDLSELRAQAVQRLITEQYSGSKAKFAEAIGVQPSSVSRWFMKKGKWKRRIGDDAAENIEIHLGLAPGTILSPKGASELPRGVIQMKPTLPEWFERYDRLPAEQKGKVDAVAEYMLREFEAAGKHARAGRPR